MRSRVPFAFLLVSLVATACGSPAPSSSPAERTAGATSSASATSSTAGSSAASSTTPGPITAEVSATIATLATAGIAVHRTPTDPAPIMTPSEPTILNLTIGQAEYLAREPAGDGILGRHLDELAPLPADAPPMSYLVAAWWQSYKSPNADRARKVPGQVDFGHPRRIIFPSLTVFLFISDLARGTQSAVVRDPVRAGAAPAADFMLAAAHMPADVLTAATLCDQISTFVTDSLAKVFDSIKSKADTILATIWNLAVDLAQETLIGLAKSIAAPVLAAVKAAAGVIGTLVYVVSLLRTWNVSAHADENTRTFGVDQPGPVGVVTLAVDSSAQGAAPEEVISCAKLAGADVPSAEPPGTSVTWEPITDSSDVLATGVASDTDFKVRPDNSARYTFQVGQETAARAKGNVLQEALVVRATVERLSAASMKNLIEAILGKFTTIPQAAKDLLSPLTDAAIAKMGDLARPWSFATIAIRHHDRPECPVEDGRWGGDFGQDVTLTTSSGAGAWLVSVGTMTFDIDCVGITSGHVTFTQWKLEAGLDLTGVLTTCEGADLTYSVSSGSVSRGPDGLPIFELNVTTGGSVQCKPQFALPAGSGVTKVTLRATAQSADQLLGVSDSIYPFDDARVSAAFAAFNASGGAETVKTGWTLTRGPLPPLGPGATAAPSAEPTESPPVAVGTIGLLTIDGVKHPFSVSGCAFSRTEADAASLGDSFGDDTVFLITGTTSDGTDWTVDIIENKVTGSTVEAYTADLKTVHWISSTSQLIVAGVPPTSLHAAGRRVTWETQFFGGPGGKIDLTKTVPGSLDVTCP